MQFTTGDIIINGSSKRKVLEVLGCLVFLSREGDGEALEYFSDTRTQRGLNKEGWQVEVKDWKPENCSKYWYIDSWGDAVAEIFFKDQRKCSFRLATNNCFRTREEAERKRENMLKK